MSELAFTVAGDPQPQGSKRSLGPGRPTIDDNAERLRPWRAAVAAEATDAMFGAEPLNGPLELDVTFVFGRPRGHYRTGRNAGQLKPTAPVWCDKRPDLDKLLRAIGDAITGIVVTDDALFVEVHARKRYGSPAAHVVVRPAKGQP